MNILRNNAPTAILIILLKSLEAITVNEHMWLAHGSSEYRYQYSNQMNYTLARQACESWSGWLVIIDTNSERDFVFDCLMPDTTPWIGYTRIGGTDCVNGECDRRTNWHWTSMLTSQAALDWHPREPEQGERCGQLYVNNTSQERYLRARHCFQSESFICERELDHCEDSLCQNNATCVRHEGNGHWCQCMVGWTGGVCEIRISPEVSYAPIEATVRSVTDHKKQQPTWTWVIIGLGTPVAVLMFMYIIYSKRSVHNIIGY